MKYSSLVFADDEKGFNVCPDSLLKMIRGNSISTTTTAFTEYDAFNGASLLQ